MLKFSVTVAIFIHFCAGIKPTEQIEATDV